jgi:5'-3' exonuclease
MLVIDISSIFWTNANSEGVRGGNTAYKRTLRDVEQIAGDREYDRVIIAADGNGRSFREALWHDYKRNREEREEHLYALLERVIEHLDGLGFHVFRAPIVDNGSGFFEADDVIASLVSWARPRQIAVDMYSGDSDLAALVSDEHRVRMLRRYRGMSILDERGVEAWKGVRPAQICALKALAGDRADGYGSLFPGVGTERAIRLLVAVGGDVVRAVEAALEPLKRGAEFEALRRAVAVVAGTEDKAALRRVGLERAQTGLSLATMSVSVPLEFDTILEPRAPRVKTDAFEDILPGENENGVAPVPEETSARSGLFATMTPLEAQVYLSELREFVRRCFVYGKDYGLTPGCGEKPALYYPGAQKLCIRYGLTPKYEIVRPGTIEDWTEARFVYFVRCTLCTLEGNERGDRIAVAHSLEDEWRARWVRLHEVPPHLDHERLPKRAFIVERGSESERRIDEYQIPNEGIYNQVYAILARAEKRAYVGAAQAATGTSGIFSIPDDNG